MMPDGTELPGTERFQDDNDLQRELKGSLNAFGLTCLPYEKWLLSYITLQ